MINKDKLQLNHSELRGWSWCRPLAGHQSIIVHLSYLSDTAPNFLQLRKLINKKLTFAYCNKQCTSSLQQQFTAGSQ